MRLLFVVVLAACQPAPERVSIEIAHTEDEEVGFRFVAGADATEVVSRRAYYGMRAAAMQTMRDRGCQVDELDGSDVERMAVKTLGSEWWSARAPATQAALCRLLDDQLG